jgi:hypothetical protein
MEDDTVKNGITKKEAAEVFQQKIRDYEVLKQTRKKRSNNYLIPENYTPQWKDAIYSENDSICSIEVPIISATRLATSHLQDENPWQARITQKIVIIKSKETKNTEMYMLSLIPDKECFMKHKHGRERIYTYAGDQSKFSGTAIYTLWEGSNILIQEHKNGQVKTKYRHQKDKPFWKQDIMSKNIIAGTGQMVLQSDELGGGIECLDPSTCIGYYPRCFRCGAITWECFCWFFDWTDGSGSGDDGSNEPPSYFPPMPPGSDGGGDGGDNSNGNNNQTVTISLNMGGVGTGSVIGNGTYPLGTQVTIAAIADSGYVFDRWEGDLAGYHYYVSMIVNENINATAYFKVDNITYYPPPNQALEDCSDSVQINLNKENADSIFKLLYLATDEPIGTLQFTTYLQYMCNINPSIESSTTLLKMTPDYDGNPRIRCTAINYGSVDSVEVTLHSSMVAMVHNHPNGTPPSAQDVMLAAQLAGSSAYPLFEASLILNIGTYEYYLLQVEDRAKAAVFFNTYSNQVDAATHWFKNGSQIDIYLSSIMTSLTNLHTDERQIYQLAAVLNYFNAGIRLTKEATGGSKDESYTTYHVDEYKDNTTNKNYVTIKFCKKGEQ